MTKVNSDGCNCLHWAAQCGSVEALQALLEFEFEDTFLKEIDTVGAPPYRFVVDVNEVDSQCRTALYLAVAKNHLQAIQYMLQVDVFKLIIFIKKKANSPSVSYFILYNKKKTIETTFEKIEGLYFSSNVISSTEPKDVHSNSTFTATGAEPH